MHLCSPDTVCSHLWECRSPPLCLQLDALADVEVPVRLVSEERMQAMQERYQPQYVPLARVPAHAPMSANDPRPPADPATGAALRNIVCFWQSGTVALCHTQSCLHPCLPPPILSSQQMPPQMLNPQDLSLESAAAATPPVLPDRARLASSETFSSIMACVSCCLAAHCQTAADPCHD